MVHVFSSQNGHSQTSENPNSTSLLHRVQSSNKSISKNSKSFPSTTNSSVESFEKSSKRIGEDWRRRLDRTFFRSVKVQNSWPQFERREIYIGEGIDFGKDHDKELRLPLQGFGWDKLMIASPKVYPNLVRLFYCNLSFSEGCRGYTFIESLVKGKKIRVDIVSLSDILKIPITGDKVFFTEEEDLEKNVNSVTDFYNSIAINKELGGTLKGKDIKDHLRSLNRFIMTTILPKGGHDDEITIFQAFILYCFEKNRQLCLPYIILHEMYDSFSHLRDGKSLPYGGVLTKVFEYFGIYLNNEDFESSAPINVSPLRRLAPEVEKDQEGLTSDEMENVGEDDEEAGEDQEEEDDDDYEEEDDDDDYEVEEEREVQENVQSRRRDFSEVHKQLMEKQGSLEENFARFSEKTEGQLGTLIEKQTALQNQLTQFSGKVDDRLAQIGARIEDGFNMINTSQTWLANFLRVYQPSPPPPAKFPFVNVEKPPRSEATPAEGSLTSGNQSPPTTDTPAQPRSEVDLNLTAKLYSSLRMLRTVLVKEAGESVMAYHIFGAKVRRYGDRVLTTIEDTIKEYYQGDKNISSSNNINDSVKRRRVEIGVSNGDSREIR